MLKRKQAGVGSGLLMAMVLLAGCEPEMGSERWCDAMDKKDKGSWTVDEGREYANSCLVNRGN